RPAASLKPAEAVAPRAAARAHSAESAPRPHRSTCSHASTSSGTESFRGVSSAASLKPGLALAPGRRDVIIPRSQLRGLIEAIRRPGCSSGWWVIPRSQLRGLIEAMIFDAQVHSRRDTFRGVSSAASLKLAPCAGLTALYRPFRGVSSAASLKLVRLHVVGKLAAPIPRSQLRGLIEARTS